MFASRRLRVRNVSGHPNSIGGRRRLPPRYAAARVRIQGTVSFSSPCVVERLGSERTRFPRLLRARYLDRLLGVVDALRPVVVERFELHGLGRGVWGREAR